MMSLSKRNSTLALLTLLAIFAVSIAVEVESMSRVPLCIFKQLTHLDCPGCGLSRSFISLSHGHFLDAIRFNALGPLVYVYLLIYAYKHFMNLLGSSQAKISWQFSLWSQYAFFILFFGQWILKLAKQIPQIIS